MKNTTFSVSETKTGTKQPIGPIPIGENNLNPIGIGPIGNSEKIPEKNVRNSMSKIVDMLLQDYAELVDERYTKWFAKRFYAIPFDEIHKAAGQAKADGKNPQQLFAYLIKKAYESQ